MRRSFCYGALGLVLVAALWAVPAAAQNTGKPEPQNKNSGTPNPPGGANTSPPPEPGKPNANPPLPGKPDGLVKPIERKPKAPRRKPGPGGSGPTGTGEGPRTPSPPRRPAPSPRPLGPAVPRPGASPVTRPPVGGRAPAGGITRRGRTAGTRRTDWETWWRYHRDAFTIRKRVRSEAEQSSQGGEVFLGRRTRGGAEAVADRAARWEALRRAAAAALARGLADPNPAVRAEAALALGKVGDWQAIPALAALISDPNAQVRESACLALGLLQEEAAQAPLLHLLYGTPEGKKLRGGRLPEDRLQAVAALALGLSERDRRGQVRRALMQVSGSRTLPRVMRYAGTLGLGLLRLEGEARAEAAWHLKRLIERRRLYDDLHRAHAVTSLGRLLAGRGDRPDVRTLNGLARLAEEGRSLHVRRSALWALVTLVEDTPQGRAALRLFLRLRDRAPDLFARGLAALAAGRVGGESAGLALVRALGRGPDPERAFAALGLGQWLRRLAPERGAAARAMRAYGLRHLRRAFLRESNLSQKAAYALALGLARDREAGPILLRSLKTTPEQTYRGYVALALGMLEHREALPTLIRLLVETEYVPEVKERIGRGVAMMGTEAVPPLLAALEHARSGYSARAVTLALGLAGDERALKPLADLLHSRRATAVAREGAARALGILGDPRPVPVLARLRTGHNYLAADEDLNRLLLR